MLHIFKKTSKHTPAYSVCTNISFKINQNSLFDNVMNDTDAECYVRQHTKELHCKPACIKRHTCTVHSIEHGISLEFGKDNVRIVLGTMHRSL